MRLTRPVREAFEDAGVATMGDLLGDSQTDEFYAGLPFSVDANLHEYGLRLGMSWPAYRRRIYEGAHVECAGFFGQRRRRGGVGWPPADRAVALAPQRGLTEDAAADESGGASSP